MNKSFTLIELMVVISIIALLGALGMTTYSGIQQSARDTRRKTDLATINQALNAYYAVNGRYPSTSGPFWYRSTSGATNWIPELVSGKFIDALPVDPLNTVPTGGDGPWDTSFNTYVYTYSSVNVGTAVVNNQSYDLVARLEDTQDPDRCAVKHYKWYDGRYWCEAGGSPPPSNIYSGQLYDASPLRF